jgi:hypothetical protein
MNIVSPALLRAPLYKIENGLAYDLHIYVQKKHISGVLFIKKVRSRHRLSLMTKTGQKLLDISVVGDDMEVHAIMPQLDKKVLLNQLKRDFNLLFLHCESVDALADTIDNHRFYRISDCMVKPPYVHFTFNQDEVYPSTVVVGGKRKARRWARFEDYVDGIPHRITIDHQSIVTLRLEFYLLDLAD